MRVTTMLCLAAVILLYCTGCSADENNGMSATGIANTGFSSAQGASGTGLSLEIPEQGGGVIVIGDASYPVIADWSCNFMSYADILGATGHGADDPDIEFAFDLTIQTSGAIAGQITLKLTGQDIRWETADAGGDEAASGITEATLEDNGGFGKATFRQRRSGALEASSGFVKGSFEIRCPSK